MTKPELHLITMLLGITKGSTVCIVSRNKDVPAFLSTKQQAKVTRVSDRGEWLEAEWRDAFAGHTTRFPAERIVNISPITTDSP